MFRQCKVQRPSPSGFGVEERVFWAESGRAVAGNAVRVQEDDDSWSDGWTVMNVYGDPVDEKYVNQMRHAHTKQRRASDI
jgi:hypothetical protein